MSTAKIFSPDNIKCSLCSTLHCPCLIWKTALTALVIWIFAASSGLGINLHHHSIIAMRLSWEAGAVTAESSAQRRRQSARRGSQCLVLVILLQLQHGVQLVSQVGEHGADIVKDVASGSENGKSLSHIIVTFTLVATVKVQRESKTVTSSQERKLSFI